MPGTRWIKVEATIVECFRAWGEPPRIANPLYEIVADIKFRGGEGERVSSVQRLTTRAHRWRPPDPGDVVAAKWDRMRRQLRLDLGGDPRYDEKLIRRIGRTRDAPTSPPSTVGGMGWGP